MTLIVQKSKVKQWSFVLVEHHLIGRIRGDMISESVGLDNLNWNLFQLIFDHFTLNLLFWSVPSFRQRIICSIKNHINSVHSIDKRKHPKNHVSYTDSGINSAQFRWSSNISAWLEWLKRMPNKGQWIKWIWFDFGLPKFISLQKWGS